MENNKELTKLLKDYYEVNSFVQALDEGGIYARDLRALINKLESGLAEEITDKKSISKKVMFNLSDDMLVFTVETENGSMVAVFSEDESNGVVEFLEILLQSISTVISNSYEPHFCDVDYYEEYDYDNEDDDEDYGYSEAYDEDEEVGDNKYETIPSEFLNELIDYIQGLKD